MHPYGKIDGESAGAGSFRRCRLLRVVLAVGAMSVANLAASAVGSQGPAESVVPPSTPAPLAPTIDLEISDTTVSAVIDILRGRQCAAVSFIPAPGDQRLSLVLRGATVERVLQEVVAQKPSYRYETIGGHDVLYPLRPEFQTVVRGVDIKEIGRFAAVYKYLPLLKAAVPAFTRLAGPSMFGTLTLPFFTAKVAVRESGRVIEQLIDLLGPNPRMYLTFGTAVTGVATLDLNDVKCQPVVAAVRFTSCFTSPEIGAASEVLSRRIAIAAGGEALAAVVERLRVQEHLPLSFIEGAAGNRVTADLHDTTARQALEILLARSPGYRCLVGNGHVVIAAADPDYRTRVHDVPVMLASPCMYANLYTGQLLKLPAFRNLRPYVDCSGDRRLLDGDEVALAGQGTVLEHLVQLLGDNPHAYFTIKRSPPGYRTMTLGSVP